MGGAVGRRDFIVAALASAFAGMAGHASAQGGTNQVVTLVVPQAPGGAVDQIARAFADYMGQNSAFTAIVVNKPGAAGAIAADFVAAAPPDGTTLLVGNSSTMVVAPQVKKTRYDPLKDFKPLGGIVIADTIMVTNRTTGFKTIGDVVAYAKANPGKLAYSSNGVGGAFHLAMEYFQYLTGTKLLHVPFNGAAPAELALVSNQVGIMVANTSSTLAHIRNGTLVPLVVVGSKPSVDLPNVPLASSVIPNFVANTWVGLYAPAGLPEAKAAELNAILEQYFKEPKGSAFFKARGFIPVPGNLQDASAWIAREMQTWGAIVAEARKNGAHE